MQIVSMFVALSILCVLAAMGLDYAHNRPQWWWQSDPGRADFIVLYYLVMAAFCGGWVCHRFATKRVLKTGGS
jgi:hypothetical protein